MFPLCKNSISSFLARQRGCCRRLLLCCRSIQKRWTSPSVKIWRLNGGPRVADVTGFDDTIITGNRRGPSAPFSTSYQSRPSAHRSLHRSRRIFFFFFFQLAGCFCVERSSSFPSFGPKSADSEFFTTCSSLLPHRSTPISIAVDESRPDHHPTPSSDRRGTKNRVLEQRPILSAPSAARCRTVRRKKGLDHFESWNRKLHGKRFDIHRWWQADGTKCRRLLEQRTRVVYEQSVYRP